MKEKLVNKIIKLKIDTTKLPYSELFNVINL